MQMVKSLESTVIIFHCLHYGVGYHSITNYNSKPFNETLGFVYLDQNWKNNSTMLGCFLHTFLFAFVLVGTRNSPDPTASKYPKPRGCLSYKCVTSSSDPQERKPISHCGCRMQGGMSCSFGG